MRVSVRFIKKEVGMSMSVKDRLSLSFEEVKMSPDVDVDFKLSNVGERIIVEGGIFGTVRLICSRCLEEFDYPVNLKIKEEFMDEADAFNCKMDGLDVEEEMDVFLYEDDIVDLKEVIRQNIVTSIPIKSLCRIECRGICPVCGKNMNVSQCSCSEAGEKKEEAGQIKKSSLEKNK